MEGASVQAYLADTLGERVNLKDLQLIQDEKVFGAALETYSHGDEALTCLLLTQGETDHFPFQKLPVRVDRATVSAWAAELPFDIDESNWFPQVIGVANQSAHHQGIWIGCLSRVVSLWKTEFVFTAQIEKIVRFTCRMSDFGVTATVTILKDEVPDPLPMSLLTNFRKTTPCSYALSRRLYNGRKLRTPTSLSSTCVPARAFVTHDPFHLMCRIMDSAGSLTKSLACFPEKPGSKVPWDEAYFKLESWDAKHNFLSQLSFTILQLLPRQRLHGKLPYVGPCTEKLLKSSSQRRHNHVCDMLCYMCRTTSLSERLRLLIHAIELLGRARVVCSLCSYGIVENDPTETPDALGLLHGSFINRHGFRHELMLREDTAQIRNTLTPLDNDQPCSDDSWFPRYSWTIMYCVACHSHIGWLFTLTEEAETRSSSSNEVPGSPSDIDTLIEANSPSDRDSPVEAGTTGLLDEANNNDPETIGVGNSQTINQSENDTQSREPTQVQSFFALSKGSIYLQNG